MDAFADTGKRTFFISKNIELKLTKIYIDFNVTIKTRFIMLYISLSSQPP